MAARRCLATIAALALTCCASCVTHQRQVKSSALEFLYPEGSKALPPQDVTLRLPLRVGLAFAPQTTFAAGSISEVERQELLARVTEAFRGHENIRSVEAIPGTYLEPGGGFDNLDRLATAFGVDVMVLVGYDQLQFSESGRSSWAYWTLIGAYVVKGEKNETRTLMDAVVYDIPSRAMLFHASGQSSVAGRSVPVEVDKSLRKAAAVGFEQATDDLIANLNAALESFEAQAATGTVRGQGTPALAMVDEKGRPIPVGEGGAGSLGAVGAVLASLLLWSGRRPRPRSRA